MRYRTFPRRPDLPVSVLGFGAMRLPTLGGQAAHIDEDAATRLLRDAVEGGVNYVDTAWPYHEGQSEPFLGRALSGGVRERVLLATKHPVWLVREEADWERHLDQQLTRLGTDHLDVYLLHALNAERWAVVERHRGLAAMERALADGRIRHLGFSFHGDLTTFKKVVDAYDWTCCQIQYNYLCEGYQAGTEGLAHAVARRVGVIVMEPLQGGALARVPDAVSAIWATAPRPRTPAAWALHWVWDHAGVVTALSGMNAPAQLAENLAAADRAEAGALTPAELEVVGRVRDWYHARMVVGCTTCGYCQPCPNDVAIADVFGLYDGARMLDTREGAAAWYRFAFASQGRGGDACLACGECAPRCPQGIAIPEKLREAHAYLTGAEPREP